LNPAQVPKQVMPKRDIYKLFNFLRNSKPQKQEDSNTLTYAGDKGLKVSVDELSAEQKNHHRLTSEADKGIL
jgi:hypothetical protein